jgi:hypothetical protein
MFFMQKLFASAMSSAPRVSRDSEATRYSVIAASSHESAFTPSSTPNRSGSPAPGASPASSMASAAPSMPSSVARL